MSRHHPQVVLAFAAACFCGAGLAWRPGGGRRGTAGGGGPDELPVHVRAGKPVPGCTQASPSTAYTRERGYGFEPARRSRRSTAAATTRSGPDFCTSDKPFFFSVALPEGNYNVTVTLGDQAGESTTTVKAESRRLMLEKVRTAARRVRDPDVHGQRPDSRDRLRRRGPPEGPREGGECWHWDDKLTLEFNDTRPCVCAIEIDRVDDAITVYLLGDSTVCDQPREPWNSWGQMLPRFFKPDVAVANHAESGESLKSFLGAKRLDKILSTMKPGDYLFIQFGHNDQKERGEGVGAFTTYKADLKRFVARDARARRHPGAGDFRCTARPSTPPARSRTPWATIPRRCARRPRKRTSR